MEKLSARFLAHYHKEITMGVLKKLDIIRGEDRVITVVFENEDGDRFDITTATEITASFESEDGTALIKKLTEDDIVVLSGPSGKITIALDDSDTEDLKVGDKQEFEIKITLTNGDRIVQFKDMLNIKEELF